MIQAVFNPGKEGEGKKRRHIKIVSRDDVFKKNVREYVQAAFKATPAAKSKLNPKSSAKPGASR